MSPYSFPPLISALAFFALGSFVYTRNPRSFVNSLFALSCLTTGCWQFAWTILFSVRDVAPAALVVKVGYTSIVFIPTAFYHFTTHFIGAAGERRLIRASYAWCVAFLAALWFTPLFIRGAQAHAWGYYPAAGLLHPLYLAHLIFLAARGLHRLWRTVRDASLSALQRVHRRYLFWAFAIYCLASVDFLANYGFDFYPFGFVFILSALAIIACAIVRRRLMDVDLAITRATVFALVYALVLGAPLALALTWRPALEQFFGVNWWIGLWVACAVLATGAHYVNLHFQRFAENRLLAEQRRYQEALRRASQDMTAIRELPRLLRLTVGVLTKTVGLTHAAVYLQDDETKRYLRQAARGRAQPPDAASAVDAEDPLLHYLLLHKGAVVVEELHLQQATEPGLRPVVQTLRRLDADLVIPSFVRDHLLGFVILGAKRSGRIYSDDDLKILMTLANQAALAIENARFYEQERTRQAEMFHTAQLASLGTMAGGMSHQLNNRFYVLTLLAGSVRAVLQEDGDPTTLTPTALQERWQKILATFRKVEDNAIRGGDIVKTLLTFSKPGPKEFVRLAMPEIVQMALELAQFRAKLDEVAFEQVVAEPLPPILGNKNQLTEILVNLLANAYDAITEKEQKLRQGALTLTTGQDYQGAITLSMAPFTKAGAPWFQLVVHDTGIGIAPEHLAGLFVPFFTTKATAEKGTGLGLFIVKRIIESHGGTLAVHSVYGEGTTFTIHLPALAEAV